MTSTREKREIPPELRRAYEKAEYVVDARRDGSVSMVLKVGEVHPQLDRVLRDRPSKPPTWCFITAWNPGSRRLSRAENEAAQRRLVQRIEGLGLETLPGRGRDPHSEWEEESVIVLGPTRELALELARAFEQNAVLYGEVGGPAELVFS